MPLTAQLVTEVEELEQLSEPWRELAHACACPAALPGWQLAWWRHLAPQGAQLRAVAVLEQEQLVGLAPFFVNPGRRVDYRLLGGDINHRLSPLGLPGREREVARLIAETLAHAKPRPDLVAFEGIDAASPWPLAIAETWPGRLRPWRYTSSVHPGPIVPLTDESYASWLASRSKRFREELRRARREIEKAGGQPLLVAHEAQAERAIDAFVRFHSAHWPDHAAVYGSGFADAIYEGARALIPTGEIRIWALEIEGDPIAIWIFLALGGEVTAFKTAFDPRWSELRPGFVTLAAAVEDAFARGDRRVDLGTGGQLYKLRFASGDAPICWTGIVPRSRRYLLTRARLAPDQCRWRAHRLARRFLSPGQRARIKRLLSRN